MGVIEGKFISGIVGPVVFKKVGNRQLVAAKHKNQLIKMAAATFDAAYVFGYASTLSMYIRSAAANIVPYYDANMVSKLTGACNSILQKATVDAGETFNFDQDYFSRLNGFEFNTVSPVKKYLFAQPEVTLTAENVVVSMPEMLIPRDLVFIQNAKYCTVAFELTLFDFATSQYYTQDVQSFEIELQQDSFTAPAQQLTFIAAPGAMYVLSLALFYAEKTFAGKAVINNQNLHPAAILKAGFCPGTPTARTQWREMKFKERKTRKKSGQKKEDARNGLFKTI